MARKIKTKTKAQRRARRIAREETLRAREESIRNQELNEAAEAMREERLIYKAKLLITLWLALKVLCRSMEAQLGDIPSDLETDEDRPEVKTEDDD